MSAKRRAKTTQAPPIKDSALIGREVWELLSTRHLDDIFESLVPLSCRMVGAASCT